MVLGSVSALAQMVEIKERHSGYLGMFNGVSIKPVLSFSNQPQKGGLVNEKTRGLNKGLNISYERILTNYHSIVLESEFSKTSVNLLSTELQNEFNSYFNEFKFEGKDGLEYRIIGLEGTPIIREKSVGIKYRKYLKRSAALAPIGGYFQAGLAVNNIEVDLTTTQFKIRTERNYKDDPKLWQTPLNPISSKNVLRASMGWGHTAVIAPRILLNTGLDVGYLFVNQRNNSIYSPILANRLQYQINQRMRRKYYHNYNFGVAYVF